MADRVRVAVVGVGEFGRQHARVYAGLEGAELVGVYDIDAERARAVAAEFQTRAFDSLEQLAREATAASVAVPTRAHERVGVQLLEGGVDVLVEKPMAASLLEADLLLETAVRSGRILQVGHTERFNPAVTAAAEVVREPLFFEVHRLGVFSGRSLDVDVVFDLMIHDLDILLAFAGAPVEEVRAVGLPILSATVDIASVRLEFSNGCVANLTASRVSTDKVRKLRFFQPHEYVSVDYARQDALVISVDPAAGLPAGLQFRKLPTRQEEPLRAELHSFVEAVRTRRPGPVTGIEGRRALELAERVAAAIAEHARKVPAAALPGRGPRQR